MDYVEQTTHSNITDDIFNVAFNFNDNVPYALVEITSLSIKTSTDSNTSFFIKTQELGESCGGDVDSGTTLAVASLSTDDEEHYLYTHYGIGSIVMYTAPTSLTFFITDDKGVKQSIGEEEIIKTYSMDLRVSYPKS